MRLNKFIAKSGECSRRQADKYVQEGSVTVNGSLELNPAYQVLRNDDIRFDGRRITPSNKTVTILLNKPLGYITTSHDPFKRKTVID
jgi:16S rRNA uridine-516 pseudouridylate synthase and related pseudouridylate synthases